MKFIQPRLNASLAAIVILAAALSRVGHQLTDGEEIRGFFMKSRKKAVERKVAKKDSEVVRENGPKPEVGKQEMGKPGVGKLEVAKMEGEDRIALGYSLYKRATKDGNGFRVAPNEAFETDTSARFVIEPNIDCYLYAFHIGSTGKLEMIYPNAAVKLGENELKAHVPYPVPFRGWYSMSGKPAIEELYIVVSRRPLQDVPTKEKLIEKAGKSYWIPEQKLLDSLVAIANESRITELATTFGQEMSEEEDRSIREEQIIGENRAMTGDVKLTTEYEPSMIAWTSSPKQDQLVLKTQLNHISPNKSKP